MPFYLYRAPKDRSSGPVLVIAEFATLAEADRCCGEERQQERNSEFHFWTEAGPMPRTDAERVSDEISS
jgi:hypothetical protein